ncbi:MAG: winged helix-turn-helix domain-containing protein [Halioglobus sp.]
MLEAVLGSTGAERVLIVIAGRGKAYAREIAKIFDLNPPAVHKQLDRMERDGLLVSQEVGRTRVYEFNPRFAFKEELQALLDKALSMYPQKIQDEILLNRRRPRRKGKPLK